MLDDPTNEDAERDEAMRELMEDHGGSADEGADRLADGFGSDVSDDTSSGRRIGLEPEGDAERG